MFPIDVVNFILLYFPQTTDQGLGVVVMLGIMVWFAMFMFIAVVVTGVILVISEAWRKNKKF